MAKIEFQWGDYRDRLQRLDVSIDGIIKRSVYPAAGLLIETIKANTPVAHPDDPDNLRESMALKKFENEDGFVYTAVMFEGYDSRGVANSLKARALESGRSSPSGGITGKHPFVRPAINKVKAQLMAMIEENLNKSIDELMNK